MREPPAGLADETLRDALAAHYGLAAAELSFLPLGHDSSAWVYRALGEGGAPYFLKVRSSIANPAALLVPRHLHDHGVANVVAPLPARSGRLWAELGPYALIVYPFVAGETGMARGLTAAQWRAYGATLRQIHETPAGAALERHLRREGFAPDGADTVRRLDALLNAGQPGSPEVAALAVHWQARRPVIHMLLQRAEELGRRLAEAAPPLALCHADIHTGNVLADAAGQVWVVDWDEVMLAPRERDLMFVAGGISERLVGPREEAWFFEGYGPAAVDPLALAYYRASWAVSDIASFGAEVCLRPDLGELTRREAVRYFAGLFDQGEIVSIALRSA